MRSKTQFYLPSLPMGALKRIEAAAKSDLTVARLTLGLFASLNPDITDASGGLFPGYQGGLTTCRHFPTTLQKDLRALVEWALAPEPRELSGLIHSATRIEKAARRMRIHSTLGRHFRRRAKRIMTLHPELPRAQWGPWSGVFNLMPDVIGKPLREGVIEMATTVGARHIQIVPNSAPINSSYTPGVLTIRLHNDGYTVVAITLGAKVTERKNGPRPQKVAGPLVDYSETGTEGIVWTIDSDDRCGHDALETICDGDHLTILDQLGATLWAGVIDCDKKTGWRPYPTSPEHGQQCALGCWVHWIQKGFQPDDWARFFIRPDYDRLRGVLRLKRGQRRPCVGPISDVLPVR